MNARSRYWPAAASVAYVCFAAAQSSRGVWPWFGLFSLPFGLAWFWRRTIPGDELPQTVATALRAMGWGAALWLAARLGTTGRPALDAAGNLGVGVIAVGAEFLLSRVSGPGGLLQPPRAARSLDATLLVGFLWAVATALAAAYALFPSERVRLDPIAIDYATTSAGVGSLLVLIAASFRLRSLRRLELGVGDRASGALALSMTAFLIAVPAAALDVAAPDRILPVAVALGSISCAWAVTTREPTIVSSALRGIVAVMLLGAPIAVSAGIAARALPAQAGAIVLGASAAAVCAGLLARTLARPLGPEQSRWLLAIDSASRGSLQPEPDSALRSALISLSEMYSAGEPRPQIWRHHPEEVLSVDVAGYLHVESAEPPPRVYEFALDEPERTLRVEVLRALEVRRPDLRGLLAWFEARAAFSATVIVDEDGPVGFILLPRGTRLAPLTLEEAQAARVLADRISALLSVSSALARSRERELSAAAHAQQIEGENQRLSQAVVGQGEAHRTRAERLASGLRRTAYSPAARSALDDLGRLARQNHDLFLVAPPGVDPLPWAAHAHLESPRSGGPLVIVDAALSAEEEAVRWLDPERSPVALAAGGSLILREAGLLSAEAKAELSRALVRRAENVKDESKVLGEFRLIVVDHTSPSELVTLGALPGWLVHRLEQGLVELPALAERAEDLRAIVLSVLARYSVRIGRQPLGVENAALRLLLEHAWPGNELELEAVLLRAALVAEGSVITLNDLVAAGFQGNPLPGPDFTPLPAVVRRRAPRRFPRGR